MIWRKTKVLLNQSKMILPHKLTYPPKDDDWKMSFFLLLSFLVDSDICSFSGMYPQNLQHHVSRPRMSRQPLRAWRQQLRFVAAAGAAAAEVNSVPPEVAVGVAEVVGGDDLCWRISWLLNSFCGY